MFVLPYKYYLSYYKKKTKPSYSRHLFLILPSLVLIVLGVVTSISVYWYAKEAPLKAKNDFLEAISNVYSASRNASGDVLANFKVAGTKTQIISGLAESSASAEGYFAAIDDQKKVVDKITLAEKNVQVERSQLTGKTIPPGLEGITSQIVSYLDQTQAKLQQMRQEQSFAFKILQIQGPDFYLPQISSDAIWQNPSKEQISGYYTSLGESSKDVLTKISQIDPPQEFKNYYELEVEYLNLSKLVAVNINGILSQAQQPDSKTTQIENAFQYITNVKNQKAQLFNDLDAERLKFISEKTNIANFDNIMEQQIQIESELKNIKLSPESEMQNYLNWLSQKINNLIP